MNSHITISDEAVLEDCLAQKDGGAIHVNESSTLTISGSVKLAGHSAGERGGAICARGHATVVNISDTCRLEEVCRHKALVAFVSHESSATPSCLHVAAMQWYVFASACLCCRARMCSRCSNDFWLAHVQRVIDAPVFV
jgi:hypothetical protein